MKDRSSAIVKLHAQKSLNEEASCYICQITAKLDPIPTKAAVNPAEDQSK